MRIKTLVALTALAGTMGMGVATAAPRDAAVIKVTTSLSGITIEKTSGYFPGIWVCLPNQPDYYEVLDLNGGTLPPGNGVALLNTNSTPRYLDTPNR